MGNQVDSSYVSVPAHRAEAEIWLSCACEPEAGRYNVVIDLEVAGRVELSELRECVSAVMKRHPILATKFRVSKGCLNRETARAEAECTERVSAELYDQSSALHGTVAEVTRPFALDSGPLLRGHLFRFADTALVTLTLHHIVVDGRSLEIISEHLIDALISLRCSGRAAIAGPEDNAAQGPTTGNAGAREYWTALLAGHPNQLTPPTKLTAGEQRIDIPGLCEVHVPLEVRHELHRGVHALRISPAVALLGAWAFLLTAEANVTDGVIFMPFSARKSEFDYNEVGLYTQILPMRVTFPDDEDFRSVLLRLREQMLSSLAYIGTDWTSSSIPNFRLPFRMSDSAAFVYEPRYESIWTLPDGTTVRAIERILPDVKFPIGLAAFDKRNGINLRVNYDRSCYRDQTMVQLLRKLARLVTVIATVMVTEEVTITVADLINLSSERISE